MARRRWTFKIARIREDGSLDPTDDIVENTKDGLRQIKETASDNEAWAVIAVTARKSAQVNHIKKVDLLDLDG